MNLIRYSLSILFVGLILQSFMIHRAYSMERSASRDEEVRQALTRARDSKAPFSSLPREIQKYISIYPYDFGGDLASLPHPWEIPVAGTVVDHFYTDEKVKEQLATRRCFTQQPEWLQSYVRAFPERFRDELLGLTRDWDHPIIDTLEDQRAYIRALGEWEAKKALSPAP